MAEEAAAKEAANAKELEGQYPELQQMQDRIKALENLQAPQTETSGGNPLQEMVYPPVLPAEPVAQPQEIQGSMANVTDGDEFINQENAA